VSSASSKFADLKGQVTSKYDEFSETLK